MTGPFSVDILVLAESNSSVQFVVKGAAYSRPMLKLDQAKLEELERGAPSLETVQEIAGQITAWFEKDDNDAFRQDVLNALESEEQVRFIFRFADALAPDFRFAPLELCHLQKSPLLTYEKVRSIVHRIPFMPTLPGTIAQNYPFRVLIVRSNPSKLGGAVPAADSIRNSILAAGAKLGKGAVEVDLLSRDEPASAGLPTFENFKQQVLGCRYHLLVFLGHGERISDSSVIKFEHDLGQSAVVKNPDELRMVLKQSPIPVVMLAGCLTAAEEPSVPVDPEATLSWVRGAHGFAQALVGSDSGVQLSVGMRYKLATTDAQKFLSAFFDSLLKQPAGGVPVAGDVEIAVKRGREALFKAAYPPTWSAPAIFRNLYVNKNESDPEPVFPFLRTPAVDILPPEDLRDMQYRDATWKMLAATAVSARPPAMLSVAMGMLNEADQNLEQHAHSRGCVFVSAARLEAKPGDRIELLVRWSNVKELQSLRISVKIDPPVNIESVALAPGLTKDFRSLRDDTGLILIEPRNAGAPLSVSDGDLLTLKLTVPAQPGIYYTVETTIKPTELQPIRLTCTVPNAILVPPL
jgi:hypothetical protein